MPSVKRSTSPTVLIRVSEGSSRMHRSFDDFSQAVRSAEAFAAAGFEVALMSATGRFLMDFRAGRRPREAAREG